MWRPETNRILTIDARLTQRLLEDIEAGGAAGTEEGQALLSLVRDLVVQDHPGVIAIFTVRSDSYDRWRRGECSRAPAAELSAVADAARGLPDRDRGTGGPALYTLLIADRAQRMARPMPWPSNAANSSERYRTHPTNLFVSTMTRWGG
jgi:hypothetical protein